LPGFGNIKVKNLKNAFDKPLRHNATSILQLQSATERDKIITESNVVKTKEQSDGKRTTSEDIHPFDIDLDLDDME
jgi:hypothetical protein